MSLKKAGVIQPKLLPAAMRIHFPVKLKIASEVLWPKNEKEDPELVQFWRIHGYKRFMASSKDVPTKLLQPCLMSHNSKNEKQLANKSSSTSVMQILQKRFMSQTEFEDKKFQPFQLPILTKSLSSTQSSLTVKTQAVN